MQEDNRIENKKELNEEELKNVNGGMSTAPEIQCPYCRERIGVNDYTCPYCGRFTR